MDILFYSHLSVLADLAKKTRLDNGQKGADGKKTPGPWDQVWNGVATKMDEIKEWMINNWRMVLKYGGIAVASIVALFNIGGIIHVTRKFGKSSNAVIRSVFCSCFLVWDFIKWCLGRCGFTWFEEQAPTQAPPQMGGGPNNIWINMNNLQNQNNAPIVQQPSTLGMGMYKYKNLGDESVLVRDDPS